MNSNDGFGAHSGNYLDLSLSNIALFTALDIRSSMFSRGRIGVKDIKSGKDIENDPFLKKIANPNFAQSQQDFLFSHLWFKSLGNNMTRVITTLKNSTDIEKVAALEHLIPSCVDYKKINKVGDFIISRSQKKKVLESEITYNVSGVKHTIPVEQLAFFYDVTNNMTDESYFKSPSRIAAMIPDLLNIQEGQSSKNVNLKHSKKWLITNNSKDDYGKETLKVDEKQEIEERFLNKDIMATNAMVKAESLAVSLQKLGIDDSIASDSMRVFSGFGLNKDIINWWANGQTTYDNKAFGLVDWIQNDIQFEGNDFSNTWSNFFKYEEQGKKIYIDYSDLPIMAILEEKRIETVERLSTIVKTLVDAGASYKEALTISGLEEKIKQHEKS